MIDIESAVFNVIATALRNTYSGIWVSGEYTDLPATFPAVTIVESGNSVYRAARTTAIENAVSVMYEVNVYSNMVGYKKSEAKEILAIIDKEFEKLGFTRITCTPVANLQEATIYRLLARYEAVVDKDFCIYQS